MDKIIEFFNGEVNNNLKLDGGGCKCVSFIDGVVLIELQGACKGCANSTNTIKLGIEFAAKDKFPEIKSVEKI